MTSPEVNDIAVDTVDRTLKLCPGNPHARAYTKQSLIELLIQQSYQAHNTMVEFLQAEKHRRMQDNM